MLPGYTAAIVGLAVVNAPETIFDTSVARIEEISLGLVCAAVAHSVFFSQNVLEELAERIDRTLRRSGTWIADALADSERLQTAGRATALAVTDSQRAFAAAEQTFAQLESAIARDQIAVFLALSGGWSETTEQTESTDAVKQ
jgi:uncharacterized membrane protein YccC